MENTNETIAILNKHVETAIALIKGFKKRSHKLEADNQLLIADNNRYKADIEQHAARIKSYEEKMESLEKLLDEAQKEQALLEQSILNAISGLSIVEDEIAEDPSIREEMEPVANYKNPIEVDETPVESQELVDEDIELLDDDDESLDISDISDIASIADENINPFTEIDSDKDDNDSIAVL